MCVCQALLEESLAPQKCMLCATCSFLNQSIRVKEGGALCAKDAIPQHKELAMPSMLVDTFVDKNWTKLDLCLFTCSMSIHSAFISSILEPILASSCKTGCQAFDLQSLEQRVVLFSQPEELCIATLEVQLKASIFKHSHSNL